MQIATSCRQFVATGTSDGSDLGPLLGSYLDLSPSGCAARQSAGEASATTPYVSDAAASAESAAAAEAWLSRFLDLGKLPTDVVEAGDIRLLRENHAREIKPLLADADQRPKVMAEAKRLAADQSALKTAGKAPLEPSKIIAALEAAARPRAALKTAKGATVISSDSGAALFSMVRNGSKTVVLELSLDADASNAEFQAAFHRELQRLRPRA
jgi:ParB family chromosome partitioning protein